MCVSKTAVGAAYVAAVAEALPALPADLAPVEEDADFMLASGSAPAGAQNKGRACLSHPQLLRLHLAAVQSLGPVAGSEGWHA